MYFESTKRYTIMEKRIVHGNYYAIPLTIVHYQGMKTRILRDFF